MLELFVRCAFLAEERRRLEHALLFSLLTDWEEWLSEAELVLETQREVYNLDRSRHLFTLT